MVNFLVTGANTGIGLALCNRLLVEQGAHVFLSSRSLEKAKEGISSLKLPKEVEERCTIVQLDVSSDESVRNAVAVVKSALGEAKLRGLVNNAGQGFATATGDRDSLINVNFYGTVRVSEAFLPLLDEGAGRIVNLGSGAAGSYVQSLGETDEARDMIRDDITMEEIVAHIKAHKSSASMGGYGLSKAAVAQFTKVFAREHPNILCSCISPGYIATQMTQGSGATKSPAEGTVAIMKTLFEPLKGNGWYYGSDGLRSPYHYMRSPGEPEYDGKYPF